MHYTS